MQFLYDDLRRLWKLHDEGAEDEMRLAKSLLAKIHPAKITIQELHFTLQALLNLYYPTDDAKWTGPLHYYHQHEWKIIPNLTFDRTWHYKSLTPEQRSSLLQINPAFFGADIQGNPRVDYCSCFSDVGGKNVVDSMRRIIVPDDVLDDARKIIATRGRSIEVVPVTAAK